MNRSDFGFLMALCTLCLPVGAQELDCLTKDQRTELSLYADLQKQAYAALDRRTETYNKLKSSDQILDYQKKLRDIFVSSLGGFPKRTPLNARTIRTIKADGYRIELVIFESQPNHHVTANLYLPETKSSVPGIVVASGHSRTAKTADYNQRFGIMMAKHGMAALCFDPVGQGERSQVLDSEGKPQFRSTTSEHFLMGVGSILVGRNTARYRVWDAIRSVDYLVARPEIDSTKIGMTGCSGGGTLTSYVMALDDRIAAAAPACYLTTFKRLIETIGPQDAEQNVYGQIASGLDHPDYILMRAPRPTLISSTTEDYFDIHGAWDTFRQAKRVYGRLGFPERVDLVEIEGTHGVKPQNLATIAHWLRRWLSEIDKPVSIADLATRPPEELLCLKSGQVLSLPGERSVFDLNAEYETALAKKRKQLWSRSQRDAITRVRELLAIPKTAGKKPTWEKMERIEREGYHIDKLVIRTDSNVPLPALTFHPPSPSDAAYVYLHDEGKLGDTHPDGPIEQIMDDGYAVVTVDLSGQGETAHRKRDAILSHWKTYYLGYLLGKPLVGMRVRDVLAVADFVAHYKKKNNETREVHLVAVGQTGIVALHTAALYPELFASVTLRKTPSDWASIVRQTVPAGQLDSTVHGALTVYDLPDLMSLIKKDTIKIEN